MLFSERSIDEMAKAKGEIPEAWFPVGLQAT
jgi:hypothetical protein